MCAAVKHGLFLFPLLTLKTYTFSQCHYFVVNYCGANKLHVTLKIKTTTPLINERSTPVTVVGIIT